MKLSCAVFQSTAMVLAPRRVLCKLSELEIDVGKEIFLCKGAARSLILLLTSSSKIAGATPTSRPFPRINAYINKCPHVGVPLNMFPDLFLTRDKVCHRVGACVRVCVCCF